MEHSTEVGVNLRINHTGDIFTSVVGPVPLCARQDTELAYILLWTDQDSNPWMIFLIKIQEC